MRKYFNTEGNCVPQKHYMVKLDDRLRRIKEQYVDQGKYFVINRGRQYGKTTTLRLLAEYLKEYYCVVSLDFQKLDSDQFRDGETFARAFAELFLQKFYKSGLADVERLAEPIRHVLLQPERLSLTELFRLLSELCGRTSKPLVLLIDEVDNAANNQVFVDFLAQLRGYYIDREDSPTFHSVILAGVYDIKNLKLKIRPEAEHQYNSPWNIAADYRIKMGFDQEQIAGMLREYEEDCHTNMDVDAAAEEIYQYTSGYPYLVSAICKILDEQLCEDEAFAGNANTDREIWSKEGIGEAVKIVLKRKLPLFDSMVRQLDQYPELKDVIGQILYEGQRVSFNLGVKSVSLGFMFGYLRDRNGYIAVANRIFEMYLLNIFIAEESIRSAVSSSCCI